MIYPKVSHYFAIGGRKIENDKALFLENRLYREYRINLEFAFDH